MESSFYMRVGVTENLIYPQIKLDGKWEVSLCDISLDDPSLQIGGGGGRTTTTTSGFRKIRKSDLPLMSETRDSHHNLFMIIQIKVDEDRLLRLSSGGNVSSVDTDKLKEGWRRFNYGNTADYGTQSSDFDKWMNDLKFEEYHSTRPGWILVQNKDILKIWENDPGKEITIQELLTKINTEIEAQKSSIQYYINVLFKNNRDAKTKLQAPPYWSLPEFKYNNGYLTLKTPYYVSRIYISEDLRRLFKFEKLDTYLSLIGIFKRVRFQVPNFLRGTYYWRVSEYEGVEYLFNTENYFINTPCRKIVSYLPGETTTTTTKVEGDNVLFNVKVDGGVLEETRIGSKFNSIFRLVWIPKGEIYKQFHHRIYVPLHYDTLNNFNIRVITTNNNQQVVNGFAILHFRKRYEC